MIATYRIEFAALCGILLVSTSTVHASLSFVTGVPTTHMGNLVTNGSFEIGAPPDGISNANYWADPAATPYAVPPGWTSSSGTNSAVWGNDATAAQYRLKLSDVLPDGRAAVDFRTATGVTVNQMPTFHPNGRVTFAAPPTFSYPSGSQVVLDQVVHTELAPTPSYNLSFWVSGEENSTNQGNTGAGILGLKVTNVLAGDPIQWLAVPNTFFYGQSITYEFNFVPLNTSLPVDISFINPGGLDLSAYGMSPFGTQPILDDVIVNGVPEPSTWVLASLAAAATMLGRGIASRRRVPR